MATIKLADMNRRPLDQDNSKNLDTCRASISSSTDLDRNQKYSTKLIDVPAVSYFALDLTEDGNILCFDMSVNRIIRINVETDERKYFLLPEIFAKPFYCSQLIAAKHDVVFAVMVNLKTDRTYLAEFHLRPDETAVLLSTRETNLHNIFFNTSYQRNADGLYLGFSRRKFLFEPHKVTRAEMIEDWKRRFRESHPNTPIRGTEVFDYIQEWKQKRKQKRESRQKQNSIESNSDSDSSTSNTSGGDDQRQHTQTFCAAERQGFFDKKDKWKTDFVFMRIVPVEDDLSEQRVYSVGSPRFGLITSKMSKDSSRELLTRWVEHKASMRPKYMNKLPLQSLCRPIIYHNEAIFVDRANPKVAFGISIFEHPDEGLPGAIRDKLLAILFRDTYSEFKREIPIDCSRGCPPFKPANWSGACVVEDGYFVCVQDCYTRQGSVWKLKLNTSENRLLSVEWMEWLPELDLGQYDLVENGAFRMDKASRTACVSCHLITKGDYGDDIIHKICLSTLHPTKPKYSSEPKGRAQRVNVSGAPSP